jgi:hypothetical protein
MDAPAHVEPAPHRERRRDGRWRLATTARREALREPLETGTITIARAARRAEFPAPSSSSPR